MPQNRLLPLLVAVLLGACGSDQTLRDTAQCDGVLNTVEDAVDDAFDQDGDGYFDASDEACQETYGADQLDCDDTDAEVNPGAVEEACNDLDDDCDEATIDEPDADEDGATPCEGDCDDANPDVGPHGDEVACDGLDNDCDPDTVDGEDLDEDTYTTCDDCDDDNDAVNPATAEVECNGLDDDCNEITLDGDDFDGDSWIHCFDCDDNDPLRYPTATDVCEDGIDQDCDGQDAPCAPPTWDGIWDTEAVYYTCVEGGVLVDFASISVVDTNPSISFTFIGGSQPGTTEGSLGGGDSFTSSYTIAGACQEDYAFNGSFTGADTFAGTLTLTFTDTLGGGGFFCGDCVNQTYTLNGVR